MTLKQQVIVLWHQASLTIVEMLILETTSLAATMVHWC
jgi:hypothetical protein